MQQLKSHQIKTIEKAYSILAKNHLVYIFGPPRIGKSLIAINLSINMGYRKVLILTKKSAIPGWDQYIETNTVFDVTNYEQLVNYDPKDYNAVIIDEAHNFSAFPKPTKRAKITRGFCRGKDIIFLSGTPVVEGYYKLYPQFNLSQFSPLVGYGPYDFFKKWGIPNKKYLYGRDVEMYDTFKNEELEKIFNPYLVRVTFEDAGIKYQNYDKTIEIVDRELLNLSKKILKDQMIDEIPLESVSSLNQALHRVCGGFYEGKTGLSKKYEWLKDFIKDKENKRIAVMAYFVEEQDSLRMLKGIDVYSSTRYCEGVDLSHYDYFILYSFGYSGAKFIQLRDRIVNINKERETQVIIPLIKNALDSKIYEVVSKKKNFNTSKLYEG